MPSSRRVRSHSLPSGLTKCPSCGSESVAQILYGMPANGPTLERDLASGVLVLGGCIVFGQDPDCHCNACGHRWRSKAQVHRKGRRG